jgi:hypothetical protein
MKSSRLVFRLSRAATLRVALAGLLAIPIAACGGSSSGGGTTTPSTPAGPTQARITVTCSPYTLTLSPLVGFNYRISVPCTITESAGLGANMNFIRLRLTIGGAEVERQEIGANAIIAQTGSNRLGANATRTNTYIFDFNNGNATGAILDFNFTDDRGNNLNSSFTLV